MPKAVKSAKSALLARLVRAVETVASAGAKAVVSVANAPSVAKATPPMPMDPKRHWGRIRPRRPMPQPKVTALPKTMNAVNGARATAMAVTAASALVKHVRTLQASKLQAMTAQSQAV